MLDLSNIPNPTVRLLEGQTDWVWCVAVSPDEKMLVVAGIEGDHSDAFP